MEDITPGEGTPESSPIPQAGSDPNDPLRPKINEGEEGRTPPIGAPQQDMDVTEEKDELADDEDDDGDVDGQLKDANDDDDALSDDESVLSEIDEAQFDDFDPSAIAIEERPVAVDESNVNLLQSHKRKRKEGEEEERKKKKGHKREKTRKVRRSSDDIDDNFVGGEEIDGKRARKSKGGVESERRERPRARKASPENEDELTPEERRRRALDKAMDEALKNPNRRHKRVAGIDLESQQDELIASMRTRMTEAAAADTDARTNGQPAMHKLKLLPEVVALLNRNNLREQLVDPDTNLLEAVRFFLEPLNDGSLPAYNIQRELFTALSKLPVNKDALVASGIGKVTIFYVKSKKPEQTVKRMAERLLRDWSRPILRRTDDFRKRELATAVYDPLALPVRAAAHAGGAGAAAAVAAAASSSSQAAAHARERKLAAPIRANRARVETSQPAYTVVPRSSVVASQGASQRAGASGEDVFRRMKARTMGKVVGGGGGSRR